MRNFSAVPVLVSSAMLLAGIATGIWAQTPAASTSTQSQPAKLEGRVLSQDGTPIRKATVTLRFNGGAGQGQGSSYAEATDAQGNFVFDAVDPGRYTLVAERNGFVTQTYGARSNATAGTVLSVTSGTPMRGLNFQLTPHGVVTGRVLDSDGDPIFGARVQLSKIAYIRGRRQLQPVAGAVADDLGNYRAPNLAPGRYYLSAQDSGARGTFGPFVGPGGPNSANIRRGRTLIQAQDNNVTTYYPNALDPSAAAALDIAAGRELRGIDIRLRREKVYSIKGKILDPGGNLTNAQLMIRPKSSTTTLANNFPGPRGFAGGRGGQPDAGFEFQSLLPGTYIISVLPGGPGGFAGRGGAGRQAVQGLTGRMEVTLSDANIDGAILQLGEGAHLTGSFRLDDGSLSDAIAAAQTSTSGQTQARGQNQGLNIQLTNADEENTFAQPGRAQADYTFDMTGIAPARYLIAVNGVPQGMYVRDIRFGGQDVTRNVLDLTTTSAGQIEVVLSKKAADVSGTVRNAMGEAVGGVMVTLWPKTVVPDNPLYGVRSATTDQNGAYRFASLAPADYLIVAWEELEQGLQNNPVFLRAFDSRATAVKLGESASVTGDAKWITREAANAEVAKLP